MKYQGWANAQTWCVALTIDNTKEFQDKMLHLVKNEAPVNDLIKFCDGIRGYIVTMAGWAWPHGYDVMSINFTELRKHYQDKNNELS